MITAVDLITITIQSAGRIIITIITNREIIPTKLLREVSARALHPVHRLPHQEAEAAAPRLERLEDSWSNKNV